MRSPARRRALAWLLAPLSLAAVAGGALFVPRLPDLSFGLVVGAGVLVLVGWIVISALWPARADRRCPECGREALLRLDPDATHGIRCGHCGFRDETRSAWLLAEEEGPLERIVLAQRRRKREPSPVDSAAGPD